jgi:polysaccharide export outer membrane protein
MKTLKISYFYKVLLLMFVVLLNIQIIWAQEEGYVLRKGDVLNIAVMGHPEFSLERVLVMPDGAIQFPGLGSIQASGMTVKDFTALVSQSVGRFVLNPIVTVYVSLLPNQVVNVVGYVNSPGQITIFEPVSVIEAISKARGIKNLKKAKKLIIIRANQSYEEYRVKDLFDNSKSEISALKLDVGDTLYLVEPKEINWSQLSFFTTLGYIVINLIRLI